MSINLFEWNKNQLRSSMTVSWLEVSSVLVGNIHLTETALRALLLPYGTLEDIMYYKHYVFYFLYIIFEDCCFFLILLL